MVQGQPSGDPLRWTPQGLVSTALDLPNEPVRTYSWYGVRGSKKYPFGKAWTDAWEIEGWDAKYPLLGVGVIVLLAYLLFMR
jgi:hypothetical protein